MMSKGPVVIERTDLAHAWAAAFDELTQRGTDEIVPLVVCISGFDDNIAVEDANVRSLLDEALSTAGLQSIRTDISIVTLESQFARRSIVRSLYESGEETTPLQAEPQWNLLRAD